jgi:hypothetical protein
MAVYVAAAAANVLLGARYQYVPAAADIVLIDFNLNTCAYCICNAVTDSQVRPDSQLQRI